MAKEAVKGEKLSIRQACVAFSVSACCYRYTRKLSDENARIADLLLGLSQSQRNWGFGLCFLHLRNVRRFPWNHKRVYRDLPGVGAEPAHQAASAIETGET